MELRDLREPQDQLDPREIIRLERRE